MGGFSSDLGVGTHSYSEVSFSLPSGATQFSCWVGLDAAGRNLPARIASDAAGVLGSPWEQIVRLRPLGSGSRPLRPGERKAPRALGSPERL